MAAGVGCTAIDERSVRCSIPCVDQRSVRLQLGDLDDRLRIAGALADWDLDASGGDGDDELDLTGAFEARGPAVSGDAGADRLSGSNGDDPLAGGEGDDSLSGGPGSDHLRGGFGTDSMDGGSGPDLVDYGDHSRPVTVDLSRAAPQGESGEGDTIQNVEGVRGGDGSDVLLGSAGADELVAWGVPLRSRGRRHSSTVAAVRTRSTARRVPTDFEVAPATTSCPARAETIASTRGGATIGSHGGGGTDRLLAGPGRDR